MTTLVAKQDFADYIGVTRTADEWLVIDQQRINAFADVTEDHQYIHVDPERARDTPFGSTIAHGLLTLSLLPKLIETLIIAPKDMVMGINYGFDKVRFPQPVRVDDAVRASMTLRSVSEREQNRILLASDIVVAIRDQSKPALVAESLAMFAIA